MGDTPTHEHYEEMKDTPWITQARDIADRGGRGILKNYNNVNVFDDATKRSIEARNDEVYKRAFGDAERNYTNIMNKYAAKNYNQFGTLNATAPSFVTDQYRIDAQRQLNDLAYNKAMNYDAIVDNELKRRYNTLNMFGNMYQYGQTPYQQDLMNWNTRNTNKDIDYQNALVANQNSFGNRLFNAGTTAALNTFFPKTGYTDEAIGNISKIGNTIGGIFGGSL